MPRSLIWVSVIHVLLSVSQSSLQYPCHLKKCIRQKILARTEIKVVIPFAVRDRLLPVVGASIKLMIGLMEACEEFFRFVTLPVSANRSEGIVQTIL